ncbi:MAG: response regulator [Planctomycetota bacterium]
MEQQRSERVGVGQTLDDGLQPALSALEGWPSECSLSIDVRAGAPLGGLRQLARLGEPAPADERVVWCRAVECDGQRLGFVRVRACAALPPAVEARLDAWYQVQAAVVRRAVELDSARWERALLIELAGIQPGPGCFARLLELLQAEFQPSFLAIFELLDRERSRFRYVANLDRGRPRQLNGTEQTLAPPTAPPVGDNGLEAVLELGPSVAEVLQLEPSQFASGFGFWAPDGSGAKIGQLVIRHDARVSARDLPLGFLGAVARRIGTELARQRAEEHRLATERRIGQGHRLRSLALFAGGLSHEVNNLMMTVRANAEMALSTCTDRSPMHARLLEIRGASHRAAVLTEQLLAFVGRGALESHVADLSVWLQRWARLIESTAPAHVRLELAFADEAMPVVLDSVGFFQALTEVLTNSLEALDESGGRIVISSRSQSVDPGSLEGVVSDVSGLDSGSFACVSLADSGSGLAPDARAHAFDPFFTTKESARGLGLSMAAGILRDLGGCIALTEGPEGVCVDLWLPLSERCVATTEDEATGRLPARVLLVEDEPAVRMAVRLLIEHLGVDVLEVDNGAEGLELLARPEHGIELAIVDLVMPRMDGLTFVKRARATSSELPALVMSGFQGRTLRRSDELASFEVLQKPFSLGDIERAMRRAFAGTGAAPV